MKTKGIPIPLQNYPDWIQDVYKLRGGPQTLILIAVLCLPISIIGSVSKRMLEGILLGYVEASESFLATVRDINSKDLV